MTWIFSSFLVTLCALVNCHILISKQENDGTQGIQVEQVCNQKGNTWWEPCSEIYRVQRIAVERGTRSQPEVSLTSLQGGASIGTSWLLEEDMGRRSLLSEYMSLHPSLTHHRNINPFENKVWEIYIFIKKCVHSFIEVCKLCLIMFTLIFVFVLYRTLA